MQYFLLLLLLMVMALSILLAQKVTTIFTPSQLTVFEIIVGFIFFIGIGLLQNNLQSFWALILSKGGVVIFLSGFFSLGLTTYCSVLHIKQTGSNSNSLVAPLVTVFSVLIGAAFLKESITIKALAGGIIVFAAVIAFQYKLFSTKLQTGYSTFWILIMAIVCGIILFRYGLVNTQASPIQMVLLRYAGAAFIIPFLLKFKSTQKSPHPITPFQIFLLIFLCLLVSVGMHYLWVTANSFFSNVQVQITLATLPFVVSSSNFLLRKRAPSISFLIAALACLIGIYLLF